MASRNEALLLPRRAAPWWRDRWLAPVWLAGTLAAIGWAEVTGTGTASPHLPALLLSVLVYPALEEIVFRGMVQPALLGVTRAACLGPLTAANVSTSLLFSAAHLFAHSPTHAAWVILPSLAFGLFRDRTASVLPGLFLHVSWNCAALLSPVLLR